MAKQWLAAREADLLPVEYYHVVFTLPAPIGQIAYHNKAVIYALLFQAAAETLLTIAADPKHLGARIGLTLVLHTWGSALTHHPHVHCIVPGGGISLGRGALGRLPARLLPARAGALAAVPAAVLREARGRPPGRRAAVLRRARRRWKRPRRSPRGSQPLRQIDWVVYAKRPFAGPAGGARLSVALHPPRGHRQQPADRPR